MKTKNFYLSKLIIIVGVIFSIISCSKSITFDQDVQKATLKRVNENIAFDEQTQRFIFVKKSKSADIYRDGEAVIKANLILDSLEREAENNGDFISIVKYYVTGPEDMELDSTDMDIPYDTTFISATSIIGSLLKGEEKNNIHLPLIQPFTNYYPWITIVHSGSNGIQPNQTVLHTFTVSSKKIEFEGIEYRNPNNKIAAGRHVNLSYNNSYDNSDITWSCIYTLFPCI